MSVCLVPNNEINANVRWWCCTIRHTDCVCICCSNQNATIIRVSARFDTNIAYILIFAHLLLSNIHLNLKIHTKRSCDCDMRSPDFFCWFSRFSFCVAVCSTISYAWQMQLFTGDCSGNEKRIHYTEFAFSTICFLSLVLLYFHKYANAME